MPAENRDIATTQNAGQAAQPPIVLSGVPNVRHGCEPITTPNSALRFEYRHWSGEVRMILTPLIGGKPPMPSGKRETRQLSARGKRAIEASCKYVFARKGGYRTFITLTFDAERRAALDADQTTVQHELARFLDGITKMYQRGWMTEAGDDVATSEGKLLYLWVAENPINDAGERNPHVHLMTNWGVPKSLFHEWVGRVERLWGQGWAHHEMLRARTGDSAAIYMAKAAKYISKGSVEGGSDQGPIRGNRYGMSQAARAPGWEQMDVCAPHIFPHLLGWLRAAYKQKIEPLRKMQRAAYETYNALSRGDPRRKRLSRIIALLRKKIKAMGAYVCSWSIVCTQSAYLDVYCWLIEHGWERLDKPPSAWLVSMRKRTDQWAAARYFWASMPTGNDDYTRAFWAGVEREAA